MLAVAGSSPLAACAPAPAEGRAPTFEGVEAGVLEDGLVAVRATMSGPADDDAVARYAECAAARYAVDRGFGFLRHIRTTVADRRGRSTAEAVYTISAALPAGLKTIDAEVTVADCQLSGIPTV